MRHSLVSTLLSFILIVVACSCEIHTQKSSVKGKGLEVNNPIVETLRQRFEESGAHMTVGEVIDTLGPGKWKVSPQFSISMYQLDPIIFGLTLYEEGSDKQYFVYLEDKAHFRESEFSGLMKEDEYRDLITVGGEYFDRTTNDFEYWGKTQVKMMEGDRAVGWLNQFAPPH